MSPFSPQRTAPHREFVTDGAKAIRSYGRDGAVVFDVKSALPAGMADLRL